MATRLADAATLAASVPDESTDLAFSGFWQNSLLRFLNLNWTVLSEVSGPAEALSGSLAHRANSC